MVKKSIDNKIIMQIVQKYVEIIRQNYNVESIILFGSYAKGTQHEDSDIDIAIITDDIENDIFDEEVNLMKLRRGIDYRLEPHIIRIEDYKKISTPFIQEIINTGIKVA